MPVRGRRPAGGPAEPPARKAETSTPAVRLKLAGVSGLGRFRTSNYARPGSPARCGGRWAEPPVPLLRAAEGPTVNPTEA
jgi:hypothetical protein